VWSASRGEPPQTVHLTEENAKVKKEDGPSASLGKLPAWAKKRRPRVIAREELGFDLVFVESGGGKLVRRVGQETALLDVLAGRLTCERLGGGPWRGNTGREWASLVRHSSMGWGEKGERSVGEGGAGLHHCMKRPRKSDRVR